MPTCSFSGEKIPKGRGIMYVLKDGKILWFKDAKCMRNYLHLKRNPRKVKWTKTYHDLKSKAKEKESQS